MRRSDEEMSDTEMWREIKRKGQQQRANNRDASAKLLMHHGVTFRSNNFGSHLIIAHGGKNVDFWPGTGKWVDRDDRTIKRRGVFHLLKYVGVVGIGGQPAIGPSS